MPPATWKLNICAAKMNAAVTPIRGTARSSRCRLVRRTAIAMTTAVTTQKVMDTGALRNRSAAWSPGVAPASARGAAAIE